LSFLLVTSQFSVNNFLTTFMSSHTSRFEAGFRSR
jgi:hypothetical protein